jgi:hypothetical protein
VGAASGETLVNLEAAEKVGAFDHFVRGPAGEVPAPLLGTDAAASWSWGTIVDPAACVEVTPGTCRASYA